MARSPKRKTDDAVTTAAHRAPKALPQPGTVTNGDIARRAYELYLGRGCEHGYDVDDWMRAERELRANSATA
jgi:Protein of unknown function (DUF2934)